MKFRQRFLFVLCFATVLCCHGMLAQQKASSAESVIDSDHDGLSDALEQRLLLQFMPRFMIAQHDCSVLPAEFRAGRLAPDVEADNGTIYGQAFPVKTDNDGARRVELRYYHLWRRDCGGHGHPLDTEHVSALVQDASGAADASEWKALYWYAAAHENTVCDVSQIARASTLRAEEHGATVWVSPGKHASYLNSELCRRGCGADHCVAMTEFVPAKLINLGEPGAPMNRSSFIASKAWPLEAKMSATDFPAAPIARLEQLPADDIAWFHPGRHPVQGIIARSSSTEQAIAAAGGNTTAAISVAGDSAGNALSVANESAGSALSRSSSNTGSALGKSYRSTRRALGTSARHVGRALHVTPKPEDARKQ